MPQSKIAKKVSWKDLTKGEREFFKIFIANGCGPKRPKWIGKVLQTHYYSKLLNAHCDQHDFYYRRGGNILHKWKADWLMFYYSLKDCIQFRDPVLALVAFTYFLAVFVGGIIFFNYGDFLSKSDILTIR